MAFMGILLANILILIFAAVFILMIILLILGIIFKACKKKTAGTVFLSLAGTIFLSFAILISIPFLPHKVSVETPEGKVRIWGTEITALYDSIADEDISEVDKALKKHPELIYYTDNNANGILHLAVMTGNVELVQCILDNGAKLDDEFVLRSLIYDYSLQFYLQDKMNHYDDRDTGSPEVLSMVELMLKNGASVDFEKDLSNPNALFKAVWWICQDGIISDGDIGLIELLISYGTSVSQQDCYGFKVYHSYCDAAKSNNVVRDDNYEKLAEILGE